jgi:integrase
MTTSRKRGRRGAGSARKRGDRWEFRFRIGGEQHSVYGRTVADARAKADAAFGTKSRRQSPPTVQEWLAEWLMLARSRLRPQTWLAYDMYVRNHIVPVLGQVRLDARTPAHIDQLHAAMLGTVSTTTAHHAHRVLSSALRAAAKRGHRVSAAINKVPAPRRRWRVIDTLTRDDVQRLLIGARDDPLGAAYVLAVTLGLRQGELCGLRWDAIQLPERRLVVRATATRTIDNQQVVSAPKTRAGHRILQLPEVAIDALMRTMHRGELVWPGHNGDPMSASWFGSRWTSMCRRAGIPPVNFQTLRHTAATLALEDGISPHVVAAMLGHASVATTLGVYAHVTKVSLDGLTEAINARHRVRLRLVSSNLQPEYEGTNEGMNEGRVAESAYGSTKRECRGRDSNCPARWRQT